MYFTFLSTSIKNSYYSTTYYYSLLEDSLLCHTAQESAIHSQVSDVAKRLCIDPWIIY